MSSRIAVTMAAGRSLHVRKLLDEALSHADQDLPEHRDVGAELGRTAAS